MRQEQIERWITEREIEKFGVYLREQERSPATVQKYVHDVRMAENFFDKAELTKPGLIAWKEELVQRYAPASVNAILAAVNSFLDFMGWQKVVSSKL